MTFIYNRTIHFRDTDAAGVVYFANVLAICHEAYEASLAAADIDLKTFFNGAAIAVPIVHATVDFYQPLFCGDKVAVHLVPHQNSDSGFEIQYELVTHKAAAQSLTRHVCIEVPARRRRSLPPDLHHWLSRWQVQPSA